jgi:STE24 endopeptidase
MEPIFLKNLLLGVVTFGFLLGKILSYLNIKREVPPVPDALSQYLTSEKLQESKKYQKENYRFGLVSGLFSFALTILFISLGWFGVIDTWVKTFGIAPLLESIVFFALIFIGSISLVCLSIITAPLSSRRNLDSINPLVRHSFRIN